MARTFRKWTPARRDRTGRRLNTLVGATVALTVVGSAGLTGAIAFEKSPNESTKDQSVVAQEPPANRKVPSRPGSGASSAPTPTRTPLPAFTPPPESNVPYGPNLQPGPAHTRSGGS